MVLESAPLALNTVLRHFSSFPVKALATGTRADTENAAHKVVARRSDDFRMMSLV
jgi:hypothetical protein